MGTIRVSLFGEAPGARMSEAIVFRASLCSGVAFSST